MAYETGIATDYLDLLSKLKTFLTSHADLVAASQQWSLEIDEAQPNGWTVLKGPGLAGADEIWVGIQAKQNATADWFNWILRGALSAEAGPIFYGASSVASGMAPVVHLWDQALPYWFVADGRRAVGVVKVSSVYQAFYLGLALPAASANQYPYPLVVGGNSVTEGGRWSGTSDDHRHFINPSCPPNYSASSLAMRFADGSWQYFANEADSKVFDRETWPSRDHTNDLTRVLDAAPDGTYPLLPLQLYAQKPSRQLLGHLSGCYYTTGQGLAAEDLITVGGVDHLVVPDVYRSDRWDYWALALE